MQSVVTKRKSAEALGRFGNHEKIQISGGEARCSSPPYCTAHTKRRRRTKDFYHYTCINCWMVWYQLSSRSMNQTRSTRRRLLFLFLGVEEERDATGPTNSFIESITINQQPAANKCLPICFLFTCLFLFFLLHFLSFILDYGKL